MFVAFATAGRHFRVWLCDILKAIATATGTSWTPSANAEVR